MTEIIGLTQLAKQGRMSVFEHFVTEEDITKLIARLKNTAEDGSERPSILAELKFITNMSEFEKDAPLSYYEELAEQFCEKCLNDTPKKFIQILFENFQNYGQPKDYMRRIVDNLLSDEDKMQWKKDSIRLKILKQFIKYAGYFRYEKIIQDKTGAERKRTVSIVDGESYIKSYIKGKTGKTFVTDADVLEFIDDNIFETYSAELKNTTDELKKQIDELEKTLNKLTANKKIIEEEMIQTETQKNKLEKEIENFNKNHDKAVKKINGKIQTIEKRIVKAQENEKKQIETLSALSGNKGKTPEKQLQEQILKVKAVRDNLRIEIFESQKELEALRNSLIEAKAETEQKIKESEQKIKESEQKIEELSGKLVNLNREITDEQNRIKNDVNRLKERIKSARDKYRLLQMADDIADGSFRGGGATKKQLYLLAMAFNMKYFPEKPVEKPENKDDTLKSQADIYDIEKNLFVDFYNNNIMRFVSDEYEEKANAFELDPSGQGINYKNFAEMIYIYYIYQDMPATEKIKKSNEMIERWRGHRLPHVYSTVLYKQMFTYEIVNMSEDKFDKFIEKNYDCRCVTPILAQNSQNTAFEIYSSIVKNINENLAEEEKQRSALQKQYEKATKQLKKLKEESADQKKIKTERKACEEAKNDLEDFKAQMITPDYGLFFEDISVGKEKLFETLKKSFKIEDKDELKKLKQFVNVLCGMHHFIGKKSSKGIKLLKIDKKEAVTRTALIIAFYYHYNMKTLTEYDEEKSFIDVYHDYTTETDENSLNSMLKKAGYQPVSDKNIFDMAVIFSSYSYLND